jgi:hypothetical protein
MRLISEDVRSIRGALLFAYVIIEEEPFQAPPEPGASCQAGSCRRAGRRLSIPNGRREIAGCIINICCIAVKLRAIHFIEGMQEHDFRKRILERTGATCLAVTRRRVALQCAGHIIVLKDGSVEAEGALADLLVRSAKMRSLWLEADDTLV